MSVPMTSWRQGTASMATRDTSVLRTLPVVQYGLRRTLEDVTTRRGQPAPVPAGGHVVV